MMPSKKDIPAIVRALTGPVNQYLAAKVIADDLRRRVDECSQRALDEAVYTSRYTRERVTDPKDDWTIIEDEWQKYHARAVGFQEAAGLFPAKPGNCPALEAESTVRDAMRAIAEASIEFFPGVTIEGLMSSFKNYEMWVDLHIKLVVNSPYYHQPANILEAARGGAA